MDIKDIILFRNLTEEELNKSMVCSKSKVMEFEKGEYIYRQDDVPRMLYFVMEGIVLEGYMNAVGRLGHADYIKEGESFGSIELFLEHKAYVNFARAEQKVRVLAVSRHFFYGACARNCNHHNKMVYNMLRVFAAEAEKEQEKLQLLTIGTLRQRTAAYLMRQSKGNKNVQLPMNREELAAYLNTTRPSLSRELSALQQENILLIQSRRKICILDFDRLQDEIDGSN